MIYSLENEKEEYMEIILGWKKRCGGHRYDSLSSHGYFINLVVCYVCYSKHHCKSCDYVRAEGEEIPVHNCPKKYKDRSLKSMKTDGALWIF